MIPSIIARAHILQGIQHARRQGIPPRRHSRDYCLEYEGSHYPPKYIIALAHEAAKGRLLPSSMFSGGPESNHFLQSRGFEVVECGCGGIGLPERDVTSDRPTSPFRIRTGLSQGHSQRCAECKIRIRQLLESIYGTCMPNHRFPWSAQLAAYRDTAIFSTLKTILHSLESFRGHTGFAKVETLPPCDFFVPNPGFIVEFDESQHFTLPRKITLLLYPPDSNVRFSIARWVTLCDKHNAKDNDPPYRDEQRAWYDTLRDLVPSIHGLKSTIRLYAAEMEWCSLDPQNADDIKTFQKHLLDYSFVGGQAPVSNMSKKGSTYLTNRTAPHLRSAVATVLTEEWGKIAETDKDCLMRDVVINVVAKTQVPVVIVFPAGFYSGAGLTGLFDQTGKKVARLLESTDPKGQVCVCLGLDGLDSQKRAADQLVVAISRRGPHAAARKFYPTKNERQYVNLGSPDRGEFGFGRILSWPTPNGATFYLAACYDGYGIGNLATGAQKPTDAIAELIHGFDPPGSGNSGVGYYPRGLARASQTWNCPVFSGAAFRNRDLSRDFPSGLLVQGWTKGWNTWSYLCDNKMPPPNYQFELRQSERLRSLVHIWCMG